MVDLDGDFEPFASAFPNRLVPDVIEMVIREWPNFKRPTDVPLENRITNRLVGHLRRQMRNSTGQHCLCVLHSNSILRHTCQICLKLSKRPTISAMGISILFTPSLSSLRTNDDSASRWSVRRSHSGFLTRQLDRQVQNCLSFAHGRRN